MFLCERSEKIAQKSLCVCSSYVLIQIVKPSNDYCTSKFTAILESGIKKLGQKPGSVLKKYTLLLP